jgi:hypothetical protein
MNVLYVYIMLYVQVILVQIYSKELSIYLR